METRPTQTKVTMKGRKNIKEIYISAQQWGFGDFFISCRKSEKNTVAESRGGYVECIHHTLEQC